MGQGVSAAVVSGAAFGTVVPTGVFTEFSTQGTGFDPFPVAQMTGGAICAHTRAPRMVDDLPRLQGAGARVKPIAPRPDFLGVTL